ncbi:MAG: cytochrome c [Polyangiaceae bacterium]|nr:cytochrome c [Polyangiaceae bacterium]
MRIRPSFIVLLATISMHLGCDRKPTVSTKEWSPSDHAQEESKGQAGRGKPQTAGNAANANTLGDSVWEKQCASCHGPFGGGDGPNANVTHPANLQLPATQSKSDQELLATIREGRGMMPKFELDPASNDALVKKIRSFAAR